MGNFIDDGQYYDGYIAAVPGIHDELEFKYRLLGTSAQAEMRAEVATRGGKNVAEGERVVAEFLSNYLQSWSESVPATADHLVRLKPSLYDKLSAILLGARSSDRKPGGPPAEHITEEGQQGNSDAA